MTKDITPKVTAIISQTKNHRNKEVGMKSLPPKNFDELEEKLNLTWKCSSEP